MVVENVPLLAGPVDQNLKCGMARKVFLVFVAGASKAISGMTSSYSSVAVPKMSLTISELSWFNSVSLFAAPIGAIATGLIIDRYGRRTALLFCAIPCTIGWFMLFTNYNTAVLLIGRSLTGISVGADYYAPTLYSAECLLVNEPHLRDRILLWSNLLYTFGEFFIYILGYVFEYTGICFVIFLLSVIIFILIYVFIPESPSWLYMQGRIADAERSQNKLGISQPVLRSMPQIPEFGSNAIAWSNFVTVLAKLRRRDVYRPLAVTSVLIVLYKFSGVSVFSNYLISIMSGNVDPDDSTSVPYEETYTYGMLAQLLVMVANYSGGFILPWTGLKKLTMIAVSGAVLGLLLVSHTSNSDVIVNLFLLRAAAVCLVTFMFQLGMSNVIRIVVGETFPKDATGFASVPVILMNIAAAIASKFHPYLIRDLGGNGYLFYAGNAFLYGLIFHLFVPETVGKTLEKINEELS